MNNNLPISTSLELTSTNLTNVKSLIRKLSPSIVCFQEIDFNSQRSHYIDQFDSVGNYCDFTDGAMAVNWDKKYVPFPYWPPSIHFGKVYSGQGILCCYEILDNSIIKLPKPESNPFYYNAFYIDRLIQSVNIKLPSGRTLRIINVHLEAYDVNYRERDSDILVKYIKTIPEDSAFIIAGDFNSRPPYNKEIGNKERTIKNLIKMGLKSSIDEEKYEKQPDLFYTFSSGNPVEMIDYIFYNPKKINLIDVAVIRDAGEISDHFPVCAKFTIKN
jgi:endonuclease/exonuclease/phosphatase family metal-dependent hydrolase